MKAKASLKTKGKSTTSITPFFLYVAVFQGATDSVLKLDLSFLNLKTYNVNTKQFIDLIRSILPTMKRNDTFKKQIDKYNHWHIKGLAKQRGSTFAIIPANMNKPFNQMDMFRLQSYMSLISPSQFRLVEMLNYLRDEKTKKFSLQISFEFDNYCFANPILDLSKIDLKKSIAFLKLCYSKIPKNKFFTIGTMSYFNGFSQSENEMSFLNNCTALEAFSQGDTELTYQISRMCAVLNSNSKEEGQVIFQNMKKFYALRSKIIHGADYDFKIVEIYLYPLINLVCQTIVQIILMKQTIPLGDLIAQSGYGERSSFDYESTLRPFNKDSQDLILEKIEKPAKQGHKKGK